MTALRGIGTAIRSVTRPLRRKLKLREAREQLELATTTLAGRGRRALFGGELIAITGSSGKSTTAALLTHLLEGGARVQSQFYGNTYPDIAQFMAGLRRDTAFAVVETGITRPGSIEKMARHLKPTVAVVTQVGLQHYTAFRTREAIAAEKGFVVEMLGKNGLAILNRDDPNVMAMAQRNPARVVTFGRQEGAAYRVQPHQTAFPDRLRVTITCRQGEFVFYTPFVAEAFWLATGAAFACAVELGIEPARVAERMASFVPPWNRLGVLEVKGGPTFLIDSVKAPAESLASTFEIVREAQSPRKSIIMGGISDYAGNSNKQYRLAYQAAAEAAVNVVFIGENSHKAEPRVPPVAPATFDRFPTVHEASDHVHANARAGDLILLKGQSKMHMERIALSWVMDVRCWESNCGLSIDCLACGMIGHPYEDHGKVRRQRRRQRLQFWRRTDPEAVNGAARGPGGLPVAGSDRDASDSNAT